jgi:hypothetical protein
MSGMAADYTKRERRGSMSEPKDVAEDDAPPRRGALIALILVVVLVIGGIWISRVLHETSRVQDCAMAGRNNCAPVQ